MSIGYEIKCHWHDFPCDSDLYCDLCKHQPTVEDKKNGKAPAVHICWMRDYDGGTFPECPSCGEMPYSLERCVFCGQRFLPDAIVEEWSKPPEAVYEDCPACGGKGTLIGTRARCNGHFHGHCTVCGCAVME